MLWKGLLLLFLPVLPLSGGVCCLWTVYAGTGTGATWSMACILLLSNLYGGFLSRLGLEEGAETMPGGGKGYVKHLHGGEYSLHTELGATRHLLPVPTMENLLLNTISFSTYGGSLLETACLGANYWAGRLLFCGGAGGPLGILGISPGRLNTEHKLQVLETFSAQSRTLTTTARKITTRTWKAELPNGERRRATYGRPNTWVSDLAGRELRAGGSNWTPVGLGGKNYRAGRLPGVLELTWTKAFCGV